MWDKGKRFVLQKILLCLVAFCALLPAIFLLWESVKIGKQFSLSQYETILLYTKKFFTWFWNSVLNTLIILAVYLPVSICAGYGFSQFEFRWKKGIFLLYIVIMILPFQATVVPQYLTLNTLGLLNTRTAVILPNIAGAFGPFLMTQFMKGIEPEILQAARIDGAGPIRILMHIVLPLCRPAIASLAILQFINCWSLIDQPLLFLKSEQLLPLSLELSSQSFGIAAFAAGVLYAVPPILAYLYCKDALEKGICLSSVK